MMVSLFSSSNMIMAAQKTDGTSTAKQTTNGTLDFADKASEMEQLLSDAKAQFEAKDYTRLAEPVQYKVLWLGFTRVTYGQLDFRMNDFHKDYLRAVVTNFEHVVEAYSDYNVDIQVDLHFVDAATPLTKTAGDDWLYLNQQTIQSYIDQYNADNTYDTVLSTVETKGNENRLRNTGKPEYTVNGAILGLKTAGMRDTIGYSTFDLCEPFEGTYPLENPAIPSLYATSVAIHEWMHQLEDLGEILDIEYPSTHAYMGEPSFPGYQKYINGLNNYDFCEFYELVLGGKLPYTENGTVQYVGMYPKMWKLIKHDLFHLGSFTFQSAIGDYYLTGQTSEPSLTITQDACKWNLRYDNNNSYILVPESIPSKRIDLSNAWDSEGNKVGLWGATGYADAQHWKLTENSDGTYCIRTAYSSGRAITVQAPGSQAVIKTAAIPSNAQKWTIREVGVVQQPQTTIYYKGYSTPYIHYKIGDGNWTGVPGVQMTPTNEMGGYTHKITIDLGNADTLTACFNDGNGNWDSRNGANYIFQAGTYTYSNGVITKVGPIVPTNTPVVTTAPTNTPIVTTAPTNTPIVTTAPTNTPVVTTAPIENATTIYYKGYAQAYIHYKVGNGNWTSVPGVKMESSTEQAGYTHKITIDLKTADTVTACFNNGNGSWDSNNGNNYVFQAGTYGYSNGTIVELEDDLRVAAFQTSSSVGGTYTPLELSASAAGGAGAYQYRFGYIRSGNEMVLSDYKSIAHANWTPMQEESCTLFVDVKDAEGTVARKVISNFMVEGPKITALKTSVASPQKAGTSIVLTGEIANVKPDPCTFYTYAVSKNGITQNLTTNANNTATWTPTENGTYTITFHLMDFTAKVITKSIEYVVADVNTNQTTIYYKGYAKPYIHYKVGSGNWTRVPGVSMEATTEMSGYTHKITIDLADSTNLTACFNDGNGNWDSRNGANYSFQAGTYTYKNGNVTKIK